MNQTGKIFAITDPQSGTSASGKAWSRRTLVIEFQDGNYTSKLAVSVIKDTLLEKLNSLHVGDEVEVKTNVASREYNGRWYTDVTAWAINPQSQGQAQPPKSDIPF